MTSPLPPLDGNPVAVKPLEWVSDKHQPGAYIRKAATPVGTYELGVIDLAQRTYYLNTPFKHHHSPLSFDAAKAAAQADYDRRIRSALVPVAAPVAAGSDEVVEVKPGLRDRLPLLAKWLSERAYFNEAKDIYGVLHFLKTAEASITADKAEIAYLTKSREEAITAEMHRQDMYLAEKDRAEASESRCAAVMAERDGMAEALRRIEKWFGEFPTTGKFWEDGDPMSYATLYGSNGERDFMRAIARAALEAREAPDKQA